MKRLFCCFFLLFSVCLTVFAQDIPVEKQDRNTYSFSVPDFVVVKDFELISAVTTETPDTYLINVRALTPDKQTDTNIQGKLLFEINGKQQFIEFKDGLAQTQAIIKDTDQITMRAVDSDVTRTGTIKHPFPWDKIAGVAVVLLLLAVILIRRRRKRRNALK
jgi:hypothetical protein